MILNSSPENQAVLSNVGQVNAFTIKATAKSFNVLASSLYANKIRAIVRELSCNAYDSHVAAGKAHVPFTVHLPTVLEPWFSIRDYGVGLNHEQVTTIFSTFFESTKTESNDFVGALGLGSKSPFSYTENFTVIACQNGVRGVYTAFINEVGVPSIALMSQTNTDEPAGVEIKFGVEKCEDFYKFQDEARYVYTYFSTKPVVIGVPNFKLPETEYLDKDIIPGVHTLDGYSSPSIAVMGNIPYPIQIPQAAKTLGTLAKLLDCRLEIHFDIGQLDFQASREGLSYIPQTVDAIRERLEALNQALTINLTEQANSIDNPWKRALFLVEKYKQNLWSASVLEYINQTGFDLVLQQYGLTTKSFEIGVEQLAQDFNIQLRPFYKRRTHGSCHKMSCSSRCIDANSTPPKIHMYWDIDVKDNVYFVINDTKIGANSRARYHWSYDRALSNIYISHVYVLEPAKKLLPMKITEFFDYLKNPPQDQILKASELLCPPTNKSGVAKNISILSLARRSYRHRNGLSNNDMVWQDAGLLSNYSSTNTHYYLPLSGYSPTSDVSYTDIKQLYQDLKECGIPELQNMKVFGVRKADIETVKSLNNWINLETYLFDFFKKLTATQVKQIVVSNSSLHSNVKYSTEIMNLIKDKNGDYYRVLHAIKTHTSRVFSLSALNRLLAMHNNVADTAQFVESIRQDVENLDKKYPLLSIIYSGDMISNANAVAEYINLIDAK
jgi:hypothetical protein